MRYNKRKRRKLLVSTIIQTAVLMGIATTGQAAQFQLGDTTVNWGNILRYNLGVRVENQDNNLLNNPGTDEGTASYDRGDIVTNRLDWYSELNLDYQGRFGARLSGAAWYNFEFNDRVQTGPGLEDRSSYTDRKFSSHTKRFHEGPSGELLDAYVYSNFTLGDMVGDIKVGRQTNLWGEAMILSSHSISYAQAPADGLKAAIAPGADAREISLPVGQVHATLVATPDLTLAAQYYFEWEPTRFSEGGSYLAGSDFLLKGPDHWSLAPGVLLRNEGVDKPREVGDWGISARYNLSALDAIVGLYYRVYDERTATVSRDMGNNTYRFIYPENAKLMGVSFSKLIGGASIGAELSYRKDAALASAIADGASEGARGNTIHLLGNGVYNFGPNSLWDSASLTGELAFSHLDKITSGDQYFNGCDNGDDAYRGCATRNVWQSTLRFSSSWVAIAPGWDMGASAAITYGLYGNGATLGGGNEKAGSYSIGPSVTYNGDHEFSLSYVDYLADNRMEDGVLITNGSQLQDRGWLSFTYKGQF